MKVLLFVFLFICSLSVSAQPPAVDDLFSEGTRHANAGRYEDALQSYKSALLVAENEHAGKAYRARLLYNIGLCYFRLDRFDRAEDQFKHAILLQTDYTNAYHALAAAKIRAQQSKALALNE